MPREGPSSVRASFVALRATSSIASGHSAFVSNLLLPNGDQLPARSLQKPELGPGLTCEMSLLIVGWVSASVR
jgi:hypothetical protein